MGPCAVVRQAGTAADKIAAATVLVQEDPVAGAYIRPLFSST